MRLLQRGEEQALVHLYERYNIKLLRYFHRMLWRDETRAQDFLQDLFIKVIEQPGRFNVNLKFSTWLYSIAHNMCKNEYRKQKLRPMVTSSELNAGVQLIPETIDNVKFRSELEIVLDSLDEDDKAAFVMRYEMEMTVKDIASTLNLPEGSVKSKLFYIRKKLSERLQVFNPLKSNAL